MQKRQGNYLKNNIPKKKYKFDIIPNCLLDHFLINYLSLQDKISFLVAYNITPSSIILKHLNLSSEVLSLLNHISLKGHVDMIIWLHKFNVLTIEHIRYDENNALRIAAYYGNIDFLKCIYKLYKLTTQDARANDNSAFRRAYWHGPKKVIKCLHRVFGLTRDDVIKSVNRPNMALFPPKVSHQFLQKEFSD